MGSSKNIKIKLAMFLCLSGRSNNKTIHIFSTYQQKNGDY